MAIRIGLIVYVIVQAIAFVLVTVGTPLEQFKTKHDMTMFNSSRKWCTTLWGLKEKCHSTKYTHKTGKFWELCSNRKNRMRAAEAFAIISIADYLCAAVFGAVLMFCCPCFKWICLILNIFGIATGVIVWALMVEIYYNSAKHGDGNITRASFPCIKYKREYNYGAGFGLIITAWCLDVVAIVPLMIPV